jgi:hypothetical protein
VFLWNGLPIGESGTLDLHIPSLLRKRDRCDGEKGESKKEGKLHKEMVLPRNDTPENKKGEPMLPPCFDIAEVI